MIMRGGLSDSPDPYTGAAEFDGCASWSAVLEFFKFRKMSGGHALLVLVVAYIPYAHLVPHRVK